jgi:hypothetical protein
MVKKLVSDWEFDIVASDRILAWSVSIETDINHDYMSHSSLPLADVQD